MDKKRKKLLLYLLIVPLILGIITTIVLSNAAPASIPATMQGFNAVKGFPVGWWRSISYEQASFWPIDFYHAYDSAALIEDILFFTVIFAAVTYLFRKRLHF